jgi:hypothetical protein
VWRNSSLCGGRLKLARHLGVTEHQVSEWVEGKSLPPYPQFQAAIEIILDAHAGQDPRAGWHALDSWLDEGRA